MNLFARSELYYEAAGKEMLDGLLILSKKQSHFPRCGEVYLVRKKEFYHLLELFVKQNPQFGKEVILLTEQLEHSYTETVNGSMAEQFFMSHKKLTDCLRIYLEMQLPERKVFEVHKPYSKEIRQRLKLADDNEHYRNWANAVKLLPLYTLPLPEINSIFIRRAKDIWHRNICGNEEILQVILRHSIEYSKTGKTMPILLVGDPGIGKTLVAKNYGKVINLPCSFISGPSASVGRGLSGAPNLYAGAGVGAIVQSMINHKAGNPVICIDEIEKAVGGYNGTPGFQNELLSALDESNSHWYDNFLEMEVDASHIPFIFTANSKETLSSPLLDRMEVVEMKKPSKEMMYRIIQNYTLPKVLSSYSCEQIYMDDHAVMVLVDRVWGKGNQSCRLYQKAVNLLVENAYLRSIENNTSVYISEKDITSTVDMCLCNEKAKIMGFCTGLEY